MQSSFFYVAFSLLFVNTAFADFVKKEDAEKIAKNWYEYSGKNIISNEIKNCTTMEYNNNNSFYIFSFVDGGFVIVSADNAAIPILGYSVEKHDAPNDINPAVKDFLKNYQKQIDYLINEKVDNLLTLPLWKAIEIKDFSRYQNAKGVAPLLVTKWDQNWPYNSMCPEDNNGPGGHVYAGCVATAMAQVMKFWNYPETGVGSYSYTHDVYGELSANFGETTYEWSNMPNQIYSVNASLATLLFHCGVSVDMNYGAGASGSYTENVPNALIEYFQYKPSSNYIDKKDFSDEMWVRVLQNELDNQRPIEYSGSGDEGGHAFVCDGYLNDYFHFNWGWSGYYNAYYYLNNLNPGGMDFTQGQGAVVGVLPNDVEMNVDTYESDDTVENAIELIDGQFQAHNISPIGDVDFMKVIVTNAPTRLNLTVAVGSGSVHMTFLDTNGETILDESTGYAAYNPSINYNILNNGIYYLKINESGDDNTVVYYEVTKTEELPFPENLTMSAELPGRIELSWDTLESASITGYNIYKSNYSNYYSEEPFVANAIDNFYADYDVIPYVQYYYVVTAVFENGDESAYSNEVSGYAGINAIDEDLSIKFNTRNAPNPFNPNTTIFYDLPKNGNVKIEIFNILGEKIKTLCNAQEEAGKEKQVLWDGTDSKNNPVASSIYFYKVTTADKIITKKMLLVK